MIISKNDVVNTLVYGAGKAGRQLVRAMQENTISH